MDLLNILDLLNPGLAPKYVRNQGNLTASYRPNSGGIKENQSNPMAYPEY